jgi:Bardet-Biedl syndrome 1 protein
MLVVGSESKEVCVLEPSGMGIKKKIVGLKSVPCFMQTTGQFDVEYRIYVACRDGKVYLIRNGEIVNEIIYSIESKPVGMLIFEK